MPLVTRSSNTNNVFVQNADPGPVGGGNLWADTNANIVSRRNDANSAWLEIATVGGGTTQTANRTLKVNSAATALEFVDVRPFLYAAYFGISSGYALDVVDFTAVFGSTLSAPTSSVETSADSPINNTIRIIRTRANIRTYSKNEDSTIAYRDDGSSIGELTLTGTGDFDSGALTNTIAAGSLVNLEIDTSASNTGTIRGSFFAEADNLP